MVALFVFNPQSEGDLPVSETDVDGLRRDMMAMHKQNQNDRKEDRDAQARSMCEQGDRFERGLDSIAKALVPIRDQGRDNGMILTTLVGDGSDGSGRIGKIETVVEKLKQFRWQVLAIVAAAGFLIEHFASFWHH